MQTVRIGKRGTIVIPAKMRKRYRLEEGGVLLTEEREDGIFLRPAVTTPVEVEIYTRGSVCSGGSDPGQG